MEFSANFSFAHYCKKRKNQVVNIKLTKHLIEFSQKFHNLFCLRGYATNELQKITKFVYIFQEDYEKYVCSTLLSIKFSLLMCFPGIENNVRSDVEYL